MYPSPRHKRPSEFVTLLRLVWKFTKFAILEAPFRDLSSHPSPSSGEHVKVVDIFTPSIARWGRGTLPDFDPLALKQARYSLTKQKKLYYLKQGWFTLADFKDDDQDLTEMRAEERQGWRKKT